jgi:hypothetical protein
MINNLSKIRPLLKFESHGDFYFIQVLKRKKDNPGMKGDSSCIKSFYVYSHADLDLALPEIIELCCLHRARAYIRLNVRNSGQVALAMLKTLAESIAGGTTRNLSAAYDSACGSSHSDPQAKWIVDIDNPREGDIEDVERAIEEIWRYRNQTGEFMAYIPTRHGLHIICTPFDRKLFSEKLKNDVHTDNPTVLYVPDFPPVSENLIWA